MKFTVSTFVFDKKDYFHILTYTSKNYLLLAALLTGLVAFVSNFNLFHILFSASIFLSIILFRYFNSLTKLKKLILKYYVNICDKGIYIFNSEDSNYFIEFENIKYILLEKTRSKAFIITKNDRYTVISDILENFDSLLETLKCKNLQFREDFCDTYENILSEYTEL